MTTITAQLKLRTDTQANWAASNPVLALGEIAVSSDQLHAGTDQPKFKIGNGTDTWSNLDYYPISGGSSDHSALSNLAWTLSGHTGTARKVAGFDAGGTAYEYAVGTSTGDLADGGTLNTHITSISNPHNVTATQVGLGNVPNVSKVDTISFSHSSLNPADGVTYYFGTAHGMSASTTDIASRRYRADGSGSIASVFMAISCTAGSNESATFEIHNLTAGTSRTISSSISLATAHQNASYTLSTPLTYSDEDEIQCRMVSPTWTTNPTSLVVNIVVRFNQTS